MAEGGALFELEDQQWFPSFLRRMQVEYIGWLVMSLKIYRPLAPVIADRFVQPGHANVVDLGSGNGGPVLDLARTAELSGVEFLLTDLYPSPAPTGMANVNWHDEPADALTADLPSGVRTMFNVYHHFSEQEKRALIGRHAPQGFLVAEILHPDPVCFLQILLATTIGQVVLCPFVRPFRWQRLLFTWIIPINILTVAWDGLVSVIRVDGRRKLKARFRECAPPGSQVLAGTSGKWWAPVTWAIILPSR